MSPQMDMARDLAKASTITLTGRRPYKISDDAIS